MRRTLSVGKRAISRWTTKHRSTTKETSRNGQIKNFFLRFVTFVVTAFRFGIRLWIRGLSRGSDERGLPRGNSREGVIE